MAEVETTRSEVVISERAATEIKRSMEENSIPDTAGLRMGVKGGGCSGFSYVLGFDEQARETDVVVNSNGIRVFIDEKSLPYLSGATLDFQDGLSGKGFTFENPNATRTCGCGHSFSA